MNPVALRAGPASSENVLARASRDSSVHGPTVTQEYPVVGSVVYEDHRRSSGGLRSSPVVLRVLSGMASLVGLAFVALLMLSDRAPGVLTQVFGERARRLWLRVDATTLGAAVGDPPPADTAVHILVWAVVAFLAGLAAWWWWGLVGVALVSGAIGIGFEVAQAHWTSTRVEEIDDVVANLLGITTGIVAAAVVIAAWRSVAWRWSRLIR
jgi:hypothetical protein